MAFERILRHRVATGLWAAVWRYRRRTIAAFVLLILAKAAGVVVPLLLKAIVDRFSVPASLAVEYAPGTGPALSGPQLAVVLPVFLLLGYALLRFVGTLFTELRDLVFLRVTQRTVQDYAERTFAHLLSLSPAFHVQRSTGSLIRDVERGTGGIGFLLGAGLFTVLPTLIEFVAVLLIMSVGYSRWFSLAIVITFVVYAAFTVVLTEKRALRQRRVNEIDSRASGRLVDGLLNHETVKTYAREPFERQRYAKVLDQWVLSSEDNQRALSALHMGQSAIIAAGVAVVMLLAGQETVRGAMTVGDLVLVNAYVIQICLPLNTLGFVFREARDALVNTEKLFALFDQPPQIADRPDAAELRVREGGALSFDHVDFAYEPGRQILSDLSLAVKAGETVAVVGGSGSGKSTLGRLLLRLYDVDAGSITVDGQDLRTVTLASLRDAIGVVPQDTALFNDTIAYNIGYGRAGAGMAEIIEAAKAAHVHEFILSLPQQYDTVVGERGMKLSGGEKQRVSIARAFLKNPPIMIFDEATSALDTRAERAIQVELERIAAGRTTVIIAHRLSTIVNADEIVVMERGRIAERGRHETLLELDGLYAQLWNLQRQQQELDRLERRIARQPVNMARWWPTPSTACAASSRRGGHAFTRTSISSTPACSAIPERLREPCETSAWRPCRRHPERWTNRDHARAARRQGPGSDCGRTAGRARGAGRHFDFTVAWRRTPAKRRSNPARSSATALDDRETGRSIHRRAGGFDAWCALCDRSAAAGDRGRGGPRAGRTRVAAFGGADGPLAGLQIMCVDDDAAALADLQAVLENAGAAAQPFGSGTAALASLEAHRTDEWPQLLVCDIGLGEEDGHAVVRRIRRIEAERGVSLDRRLPAVALSGRHQPDDRIRALMAGFQLHIAKPIEPARFVGALRDLAGQA